MQIKVLKGMKDMLPNKSSLWQYIENKMRETCKVYNFKEIRTPVVEATELFCRGVGDTTDIVQKEMYTFKDKGGRSISLKPEGTAGTVRAFLEASLHADPLPCKLYYVNSPIYRYEAPQSGRLREHHQFGVECFGTKSPTADAEIISLGYNILNSFNLSNIVVDINSIGCEKCRPVYTKELVSFLKENKQHLCKDCLNRYEVNPLRVLDCKNETCISVIENAPKTIDYLCDECKEHFTVLQHLLLNSNISFKINPKVVRGLDYYTKTVFEFIQNTANGNLTVCGGGRYDNLIEQLGGPTIPAVGFGMGMERLIMLIDESKILLDNDIEVYICNIGDSSKLVSFNTMLKLRSLGIKVDMDHMQRSLKAQFKYANKISAKFVLIIGGEELERNVIKIRNMQTKDESEISIFNIENKMIEILSK